MPHIGRPEVARYAAAVAFLAAVTVAALLIRSGIKDSDRPATTSTPPVAATTPKHVPPSKRRYYVVRSGDTLADIALRFHTTVGDLRRLNPGVKPTSLFIHHRLRVK